MMKNEIAAAVLFLTRLARHDSSVPDDKVEQFSEILTQLLSARFENHWYEDKPHRGQAYRCITFKRNHIVDPVLFQAAMNSGIASTYLNLPLEFTLWVDPEEVCCRLDESIGGFFNLASFKSGNVQNKASTIDISELIEQNRRERDLQLTLTMTRNNRRYSPSNVYSYHDYNQGVVYSNHDGQQAINYSELDNQQVQCSSIDNQHASYSPVDNQQSVYGNADNQHVSYSSVDNQQSVCGNADNQHTSYSSVDNQQSVYGNGDDQQHIYSSAENQAIYTNGVASFSTEDSKLTMSPVKPKQHGKKHKHGRPLLAQSHSDRFHWVKNTTPGKA